MMVCSTEAMMKRIVKTAGLLLILIVCCLAAACADRGGAERPDYPGGAIVGGNMRVTIKVFDYQDKLIKSVSVDTKIVNFRSLIQELGKADESYSGGIEVAESAGKMTVKIDGVVYGADPFSLKMYATLAYDAVVDPSDTVALDGREYGAVKLSYEAIPVVDGCVYVFKEYGSKA